MYWLSLLIGIFVWPELAFCVLLFVEGYPLLGLCAVGCTFFSGKKLVMDWVKKKIEEKKLSSV